VRESTRRRIAASSTGTISDWAPHAAHQPITFLGLLMNNMRSVSMVISVRFLFICPLRSSAPFAFQEAAKVSPAGMEIRIIRYLPPSFITTP